MVIIVTDYDEASLWEAARSAGACGSNGVMGEFAMGASYLGGKVIAGLLYTEHRATGNVTLISTAPTSLSIVCVKTAIVLSTASRNGVGNYSMQVILGDKTGAGNTDQIGLQVKDPSAAVVPDLTSAPTAIKTGDIAIVH